MDWAVTISVLGSFASITGAVFSWRHLQKNKEVKDAIDKKMLVISSYLARDSVMKAHSLSVKLTSSEGLYLRGRKNSSLLNEIRESLNRAQDTFDVSQGADTFNKINDCLDDLTQCHSWNEEELTEFIGRLEPRIRSIKNRLNVIAKNERGQDFESLA